MNFIYNFIISNLKMLCTPYPQYLFSLRLGCRF